MNFDNSYNFMDNDFAADWENNSVDKISFFDSNLGEERMPVNLPISGDLLAEKERIETLNEMFEPEFGLSNEFSPLKLETTQCTFAFDNPPPLLNKAVEDKEGLELRPQPVSEGAHLASEVEVEGPAPSESPQAQVEEICPSITYDTPKKSNKDFDKGKRFSKSNDAGRNFLEC